MNVWVRELGLSLDPIEATRQLLKAVPGTWGPSPVKLTYKWYAGTTVIRGQTGKSLRLTSVLVGKQIKVKVTGTKAAYVTRSKTSAATLPVKR